jgi:hypothetical protein
MRSLMVEYLLLSIVASFGVLLFATACNRLQGLYLMGRKVAQVTGLLLAAGAFIWFFASAPRNLPDTMTGIGGVQQTLLFSLGAGLALALLLLLSSLRTGAMSDGRPVHGLAALRHNSYLRLISAEVSALWKSWRQQTKKPSSG